MMLLSVVLKTKCSFLLAFISPKLPQSAVTAISVYVSCTRKQKVQATLSTSHGYQVVMLISVP